MKKFIFGALTVTIIAVMFGFDSEADETIDVPEKEWIISPRFLTL